MRDDYFVFDGKPSTEFNAYVFGHGTYKDPSPDFTESKVPGRNGTLHFFNGRYNNIEMAYPVIITADSPYSLKAYVADMRAWFSSKTQYCRLEDTYNPDFYRMGIYKGGTKVKVSGNGTMASFAIQFDCMPQKFLKSGEMPVNCINGSVIYNPTLFNAKPIIRAYGVSGTVNISGVRVGISGASEYIDIDCDIMEAYKGSENLNSRVTLTDGEFPVIIPGENAVAFEGLTKVEIKPRFWTL